MINAPAISLKIEEELDRFGLGDIAVETAADLKVQLNDLRIFLGFIKNQLLVCQTEWNELVGIDTPLEGSTDISFSPVDRTPEQDAIRIALEKRFLALNREYKSTVRQMASLRKELDKLVEKTKANLLSTSFDQVHSDGRLDVVTPSSENPQIEGTVEKDWPVQVSDRELIRRVTEIFNTGKELYPFDEKLIEKEFSRRGLVYPPNV